MFLVRSLAVGGAERQIVTLAAGLKASGCDVIVAALYSDLHFRGDLDNAGIETVVLGKRDRWEFRAFASRLAALVREWSPDIVHSYLASPNVFSSLLRPWLGGAKVVWGLRSSGKDTTQYGWPLRVGYWLEARLSRVPDLIISNSYAGRDDAIRRGFPRESFAVIPNGIDIGKFRPDRTLGISLRRELGLDPNHLLVGLLGRLDPMKDHPTFLQAAARFANEFPAARFLCVGTGPKYYLSRMQSITSDLGLAEKVIWHDAVVDTSSIYNALDIFTSSSAFGEGFANVIGEAMSCGLPCVVTDVGDSARIIGDCGIVVPPRDPEALAKGWTDIFHADRACIGAAARSRIEQEFSVQKLVSMTIQTLECVVKGELP